MKKTVLIFLSVLILLVSVSCELNFSADKPKIYLLSWGNSYQGTYTDDSGNKKTGIAVDKYIGPDGNKQDIEKVSLGALKLTEKDANDVADAFSAIAKKAGYDFECCKILTSDCNFGKFEETISDLKAKMLDSDILIAYFSGHGGEYRSKGLDNVLCFSDVFVSYEYVKKVLDSVSKGQKAVFFDVCYSGSFIPQNNGVVVNPDISKENPLKYLFSSSINETATIFALCSSKSTELSWESSNNGIFTSVLLKALGWNGKELGNIGALKNNKLTMAGIAKYLYDNVSKEKQTPVFSGRSDDIILFKF